LICTDYSIALHQTDLHMKKQLLTLLSCLGMGIVLAQTPSPSWTISQNAAFTNTSVGIRFMDAVDPNVVWVVGYDGFAPNRNYNWFSRTINGGSTFTAGTIFPDTSTYVLANMEGVDANTAWVCSYLKSSQAQGAIHRTTNGGANWQNMTAAGMFTNAASFANVVSFFTPSVGMVMGDPINGSFEIWRTTNGGLSWSPVPAANIPSPLPGEYGIVNLYYKQSSSNLWYGTQMGRIYYTNNAGLTWSVSNVGAQTNTVIEIAFTTPNNGIAYVVNAAQQFDVYNTTNGGATWSIISPAPANVGRNDIVGVPGTNQFVSFGAGTGNQIVSFSTNNGVSWTDYGSVNIQYLTGDFVNSSTGWAGSFSDNTNPNVGGIWKYNGAAIQGTVAPTAAFTMPANLCLTGSSATLQLNNSSTGSPAPTYSWSSAPAGGSLSSPTATTPVLTFTAPGNYTVVLRANNAAGTNSTALVINVQACSLPTVNFAVTSGTICNNGAFTATNTSNGGSPAPSYSWSAIPSAGVTFSPSSLAMNPSIKAATPGTYTIVLEATNSQGVVTYTQSVNVVSCLPAVDFTVPSTFFRCNDPANRMQTINGSTSTNGAMSYTWSIQPTSGVSIAPPGVNGNNILVAFTNTAITNYSITLRAANASGTTIATKGFTVDYLCLGVQENYDLSFLLDVYPNPAHDQFNVRMPRHNEPAKVRVVNLVGALVFEDKSSKEVISINMANRPKGVYFVTIEVNGQKATKRLVIE
jgi:photosystem II stability/assembly factor-like uncharacterized protein